MATNERKLTSKSVKQIMSKRITVPAEAVGKRVMLTIQGNGNTIDVVDGNGKVVMSQDNPNEVLRKTIFNLKANSAIAMVNPRNKDILVAALKAERSGADEQEVHDAFSDYLNKCQMSFSVILPSTKADRLADGIDISAKIVKIDTENGSLLTIDPSSISVVEPEVLGTTEFELDSIFAEIDAEEKDAKKNDKKAAKAGSAKGALKA